MRAGQGRLRRLERARTHIAPAAAGPLEVPNIIDFVTRPEYLNRPQLYPRQATLLKIIFLEVELLTDYDLAVIEEWEAGFTLVDRDASQGYEGGVGLAPGTVERMRACRAEGRSWFREVVLVLGRRAGKGYLSSLVTAYVTWKLLALGDPQRVLGIEKTKQLVIMTMAAELSQAVSNQHRDLVELLGDAPCFAPYVASQGSTSLRLRTPAQLAVDPNAEGSLLIQARPATPTAGRGPTAVAFLFDEMAHAPAPGLQRGADEIYRGAMPALAQFPTTALTLLASSPSSQTGEFYAAYRRALATASGAPVDPTAITVQLPSWGTYADWERTHSGLAMYPGGPQFLPLQRAIIAADDPDLRRLSNANADTHAVEHLAQWRTGQHAYLNGKLVRDIFGAYNGALLARRANGLPGVRYVMHCDPSISGANFAIAIGHLEHGPAPAGHVVFDHLEAVQPGDFPDGRVDYAYIERHLGDLVDRFAPAVVTFDQFNSEALVQALRARSAAGSGMGSLNISTRPATQGRNWQDAERFKTLMGERRIHAHEYDLAKNELLFLEVTGMRVDHPRTGPVTTSDVTDCMFNVVAHLMDGSANIHAQLSATGVRGGAPGGFPINAADQSVLSQFSRRRRPPEPYNPARGRRRRP